MEYTKWTNQYTHGLTNENDEIEWNGIDYTMKSWIEFRHNGEKIYLEKDEQGYDKNYLAINTSIKDLQDEYGEGNYPQKAIEEGKLLVFETDRDMDNYIKETYELKTYEQIYEIAKERYLEKFVRLYNEDLEEKFSPENKNELERLQKALGFTKDEVKEIEEDFLCWEESRLDKGIKGFRFTIDNAEKLKDFWNNTFHSEFKIIDKEYEQFFYEQNKPFPALPVMTDEMAKAILDIIDVSNHNLYVDFYPDSKQTSKFYIEARNDDYWKATDNVLEVIDFADRVVEEWHRDETTITENKYYDIVKSIVECDDILLPMDIRFHFTLPNEVYDKYFYDENGNYKFDASEKLLSSITDTLKHKWYLENIGNPLNRHNFNDDYVLRCNLVVKEGTDYSNIQYNDIENVLLYQFAMALNKELGLDYKSENRIKFDTFSAEMPTEFQIDNELVIVNKENFLEYKQTPEEFANSLALSLLRVAHSTVYNEVAHFMSEQKAFNKVLKENPLLKKYAENNWAEKKVKQQSKNSFEKENEQYFKNNFLPQLKENLKDNNDILLASKKVLSSVNENKIKGFLDFKNIDNPEKLKSFLEKEVAKREKSVQKNKDKNFEREIDL